MSALREKRKKIKKKSSLLLATPTIGYSRITYIKFFYLFYEMYIGREEKGEMWVTNECEKVRLNVVYCDGHRTVWVANEQLRL